jgi:FtsP/CotA-like multicopper oxidase with cupredoxin domain
MRLPRFSTLLAGVPAAALVCGPLAGAAYAQQHLPMAHLTAAKTAPGPCAYQDIDINKYGRQPFQNPPALTAQNGQLKTTVAVQYTDPEKVSIAGCKVMLRSYNGALVGPTLRLKPGDVLNLLMDNQLPRETPKQIADQFEQEASNAFIDTTPHSFNTTNLHTHGLHVSPKGNSDNVLIAVEPQTKFQYEIKLPANHTRGSYWYHAHAHGSTAVQVGSGMAGALIIDDDEAKLPAPLRDANKGEKVFVFGSILYDTKGVVDDITAFFPDSTQTEAYCKQGLSSCTWQNSLRRTTINGQIVPQIHMKPGEVQRWRFIDATFRETLNLQLEGHTLNEIATDGIYTGWMDAWGPSQSVVLQPGYRSDVLVQASLTPGTYSLIDAPTSAAQSLRGVAERQALLAEIIVDNVPAVTMRLPTNEELAPLAPFPSVSLQTQADGVQEAVFKLGSGVNPSDGRNYFQVNYAAFNPTRIRYVKLGATDMWSLTTVGDPFANGIPPLPHVFHIHVNPFQTTRTDPRGNTETVWKDTLLVPAGTTQTIYTQYLDYTGAFVMHCHILDHEDLGMMEVVEVVDKMPPASMATMPGHMSGHR